MSSLPHTSTGPGHEGPSTSATTTGGAAGGNLYPKESTSAAEISNAESKVGMTSNQTKDVANGAPGSAEAAAEKLYEERIEEEYAKREGGA
ncbi:hypothetical protein LTR62_000454 [Meristemomyces frigidus]|uniref:Uncharacterized protein n=1 Tax=Meristemomyces frigidus TaxID=1508187 RepID=A0AAN7YM46_9PEZI|nr:hypothetical protein LTR62_000454 [Meristemomyces frigidus]